MQNGTLQDLSALRANLKKAWTRLATMSRCASSGRTARPLCHFAADFTALEETAYLLRSPENARRLLKALHGDRSTDREFASVHELRTAIGLDG